MVYKIRNKNFFHTRAGWKNNWHPKNFNSPRHSQTESTMSMRCRSDHHSFLRMFQSYRNISRHCKQYFYGDKALEEVFTLGLRSMFLIPLLSECQTDKIKHGGERRMADQLDRDFELISYNQHPYQLFTYQNHNKFVAQENEEYETKKNGEQTYEQQMLAYLDQIVKDEQQKLPEGEKLSLDRITEIIFHAFRKARDQQPSQSQRNQDGEINDFMEQRRPFNSPNPSASTH